MLKVDLTGQTFHLLQVLEVDVATTKDRKKRSNGKNRDTYWLCRCSCGNLASVRSSDLRASRTKSCGCLQRKIASEIMKKYNEYDLNGTYGVGYTKKGAQFLFDLEDYDLIKDICWYSDYQGYIIGEYKGKSIKQHRFIMNYSGSKDIDHINHKVYDNRKENLRLATRTENSLNRKSKNAYYSSSRNRWIVEMNIMSKRTYIGTYLTEEEALKAVEEAKKKYPNDFRYKGE